MKKFLTVFLVLALALALFVGCGDTNTGGDGDDSDVIKIGVFEPLTGANASGGEMEVRGIELAHEYLGDLLGKKVELVKIDNKSDAVEAATAASRLVESEKVDIVLGSWGSTLSIAGGDAFANSETVAIAASATNPNVTLGNDYYYRICFLDPFQGTVLANYAYKTMGATKVGIIYETSNDYAVGLRNFFKTSYEELGGTIVAEAQYQTNDQDFNSQLMTVMAGEPDVIFAPGNYTEAALIMKQAIALDYTDIKFLGGDTWETPAFLEVGGADVEGCVITTFFDPEAPINDMTTTFVELYREKYGEEPSAFSALGFDVYLTAYKAIEAAGSTDSAAIKAAMETLEVEGCTGAIRFDENGDAIKNMAVLKTVEDGKFKFLDTVTID